jgi:hypothetical protein
VLSYSLPSPFFEFTPRIRQLQRLPKYYCEINRKKQEKTGKNRKKQGINSSIPLGRANLAVPSKRFNQGKPFSLRQVLG